MFLVIKVAVVFKLSTPGILLGLETAINLVASSIKVNCLTPGCSSLNKTCSVIRFQIRTFPDSVEMMYLNILKENFDKNLRACDT